MLRRLHRDEPHRRPRGGVEDRLRIDGVVLRAAHEGLDEPGIDQPDLAAGGEEGSRPVVGRRACLHGDDLRGEALDQPEQLGASNAAGDHAALSSDAVDMEWLLG